MKTDITHIYNRVYRTAFTMLCLISFFSCVKTDFCKEDNHLHTGNIKLVYHWPENIGSNRPDSMFALVNRVINTHRIGYITDSETSVGGRYYFGKVYDDATVNTSSMDAHPLMSTEGDYQVFAFSNDAVCLDGEIGEADYRISNLREFGDGTHLGTVDIRDIAISYVTRDVEDENLKLYTKGLHSFNPEIKYIATDIKPVYCALNHHEEATQEYTFSVNMGEESEVHLYPESIMQDLTISFPLYADEQVVVDSVIAEISGIPHKMMIYSGMLDIDTVCKMQFKMTWDENSVEDKNLELEGNVNKTFKKRNCLSTISVISLLANKTPNDVTGAGILRACVYVNGEKTPRYARINMYNTIRNANLLIASFDGIMRNLGTDPELPYTDTLRIDNSSLIVTQDGLMQQTSVEGASVDSWVIVGF